MHYSLEKAVDQSQSQLFLIVMQMWLAQFVFSIVAFSLLGFEFALGLALLVGVVHRALWASACARHNLNLIWHDLAWRDAIATQATVRAPHLSYEEVQGGLEERFREADARVGPSHLDTSVVGLLGATFGGTLAWALGQMITIALALWIGTQARIVLAEPWAAIVRWVQAF